jgi:hypothetical protein
VASFSFGETRVSRLHIFAGGGRGNDPLRDDKAGIFSLGVGVDVHPHVSVGLEARAHEALGRSHLDQWNVNAYGKAAPFLSSLFNPYGRVGVGGFKVGEDRRASLYGALGLELGSKNLGLYLELGYRATEGPDIPSLVAGLSFHH